MSGVAMSETTGHALRLAVCGGGDHICNLPYAVHDQQTNELLIRVGDEPGRATSLREGADRLERNAAAYRLLADHLEKKDPS